MKKTSRRIQCVAYILWGAPLFAALPSSVHAGSNNGPMVLAPEVTEPSLLDRFQSASGKYYDELIDQWNRLDIKTGTTPSKTIDLGSSFFASGGVGYQFQLGPSYIDQRHRRVDSYLLRAGFGLEKEIGIAVRAEAQVSFSRLFTDKTQAATAIPRWLDALPRTTEDVRTKMAVGDAVRIEISSDGSFGKTFGKATISHLNLQAGASLSNGTRFLVDFFKISENKLRVRFITTRTRAKLGLTASVNALAQLEFGPSFVSNALDNILSCRPLAAGFSTTFSGLPVDVMAVDYILDINQPVAARAFDGLAWKLLTMQTETHINLFMNENQFMSSLSRFADILEIPFRGERSKEQSKRAIDRIIKVRTLTQISQASFGSDCVRMWSAKDQDTLSTTLVRVFDRDERFKDYYLLGGDTVQETNAMFGQYHEMKQNSAKMLFDGRREDESDPLSLVPGAMLEIRFKAEIEDKHLKEKETQRHARTLSVLYPRFAAKIQRDIDLIMKSKELTNAYCRLEFGFDRNALALLPRNLTGGEVRARLIAFMAQLPTLDIFRSGPPILGDPQLISGTISEGNLGRFSGDIGLISVWTEGLLNEETPLADKVKAVSALRRIPLFRDLGAAFYMSLMPQDERLNQAVSLTLSMGSTELANKTQVFNPTNKQMLLRDLDAILDVVNSRSFNLNPGDIYLERP